MVYTDQTMPEIRSAQELTEKLGAEDRLVAMAQDWKHDGWGMNAQVRNQFEILLRVAVGEDEALLVRRRGNGTARPPAR